MNNENTMINNKKIFSTRLSRGNITEIFLTIPALPNEEPSKIFRRLNDYLHDYPNSQVVKMTALGSVDFIKQNISFQDISIDTTNWPITWIGSKDPESDVLAGIQVHLIDGVYVEPIMTSGQVIGCLYEDTCASYCLLSNILPDDPKASREEQTQQVFDKWKSTLEQVGMKVSNIVRTWLFLDDILSWYNDLNKIRNDFFSKEKVYDGIVPASTCVSGCNPLGAALTTDLVAIQPKTDDIKISMVPSPLQSPAMKYGSSFSRAVEFTSPQQQQLFISGTASIDLDGKTLHEGDIEAQIDTTMQVIRAILKSRGMDWPNVNRAIAYFKYSADIPCFQKYCQNNNLTLPVIIMQGDICRDDLLFEMELDAISGEQIEREYR